MKQFLLRTVVTAFTLLLVAEIIPGILVDSLRTAIVGALIIGILNALVRPVLLILTLPVTILTLGLFIFVINASILWFAGSLVSGFSVSGFLPALFGSIVLSIVGTLVNRNETV